MSIALPHTGSLHHPDGPVVHVVERVVGAAVHVMRFVMIAVFAGVVGLSLLLAVATNRSHSDTLEVFGHSMFIVESGSMSPAIGVGDAVLVKPLDEAARTTLAAGDVVTFHAADDPTMHITHRILGRTETADGIFYRTKGDANPEQDPFEISSEQVFGVVEHRLAKVGYVLHLVQQPRFIVTVLAALVLSHVSVLILRLARRQGGFHPHHLGTSTGGQS